MQQSLFFIIIGFVVGIPISQHVLSTLMSSFGKDIYLVPSISIAILVITFSIILPVPVIRDIYFSREIKSPDMASTLKDMER